MSEREFLLQLGDAEVAALVEVMFLAAEADGEVDPGELGELSSSIERVTSGAVAKERAQALVESASAALASSDRTTRLGVVKAALTPAQRKHALLLAIQVTVADGQIRTSERELILETAEALDIDGDTAADLVKVVAQSSS
jgi:uncharacterized tellurite resistance protein B-like protein